MKELLSFLASKTQSFVGLSPLQCKDPGTGAVIAQERIALFAESFNSISPATDIPKFVNDLGELKLTDRVLVFEAAMGAAIRLDVTNPREYPRSEEMIDLAPEHIAALGLGAGTALSHMRVEADITPALSEHYLGWLAMDAYGMHEGYFHWFDSVHKMKVPLTLPPLAMAAYHQGLGRAIWCIGNGAPKAVNQIIERFPVERRAEIWRGVGLMVCFWGAKDEQELKGFYKVSKQFRPYLQQGVAQAVSMRIDMNEVVEETDAAVSVICGASSAEIDELVKDCLAKNTDGVFDSKALVAWQDDIVEHFAKR